MKIKKFNEAVDDHFDYKPFMNPITFEVIKDRITAGIMDILDDQDMDDVDINDFSDDIHRMAQRFLYGLWDEMTYMGDNKKEDFWDIINGTYE